MVNSTLTLIAANAIHTSMRQHAVLKPRRFVIEGKGVSDFSLWSSSGRHKCPSLGLAKANAK